MRPLDRGGRGALLAAQAVLAAGLVCWSAPAMRGFLAESRGLFDMSYVSQGEALLHAAHSPAVHASYRMPIGPLLEALAVVHLSPGAGRAMVGLFSVLALLLVFALGGLLGPAWCGLLAVALWEWILSSLPLGPGFYKQFFYTPLLLTVAGLLVWRAQKPSLRKSALLGCAIGASLLFRGTLAFFPPLLALYDWNALGRPSLGRYWKHLLALCLLPTVFLIPWTAMNWSLYHEFAPLEHGAPNMNIVTGALGAVTGAHGNFLLLTGGARANGFHSVLGWALCEVARHPWRYGESVIRRVWYAMGLNPLLFALAGLSLFLFRRRQEFRELALLCLYFLGINCLMSIEDNYFEPLWPLLAALAAALASGGLAAPKDRPLFARACVCLGLALGMALSLWSERVVGRYLFLSRKRPPTSDQALEGALGRSPQDGWLLLENSRRRLGRSDAAGAVKELALALSREPDIPSIGLELAFARMKAGDAAPLLQGTFTRYPESDFLHDDIKERVCVYKALGYRRAGHKKQAREQLELALSRWRASQAFLHPSRSEDERQADLKLREASDERFVSRLDQILSDKPWEDRLSMIRTFTETRPNIEINLLQMFSFLYTDPHDLCRRLPVLEQLTRDYPKNAVFFKDRGVCEYLRGSPKAAAESLKTAIKLDPRLLEAYASLGAVYVSQKRPALARRVYDSALAAGGQDSPVRTAIMKSREELSRSLP